MKANKRKELKNSDLASLVKKASEIAGELAKLDVGRYTNPSKNLRARKMMRKELAVIRTIIREKELRHE